MRFRPRDRNRLILIAGLCLCALVALINRMTTARGRIDPLEYGARNLLISPALSSGESLSGQSRLTFTSIFTPGRLARENRRLKARVTALEIQNAELQDEAAQNIRLRRMLDMPDRQSWDTRAAEVIALKPSQLRDTALLRLAHPAQAHIQDVILDQNGDLVGQVVQVTGSTCDGLLLTDPLSGVGARVVAADRPQASKAVVGICIGNRSRLLQLIDLPGDADIEPGDQIVTSGLGGVYPPSIRIGAVVDVQVDSARFLKTADVAPYADFNGLREVFLRR